MGKALDYDIILFDFDGTISDSAPGIIDCFRRALTEMGRELPPESELRSFVGPPLAETFENRFGFKGEELTRVVSFFRDIYKIYGVPNNEMYPGVEEMLDSLRAAGKTLAVATSKPEVYAAEICRSYGVADKFDFIAGSVMDLVRNKKSEVIEYVMEKLAITDRSRVLMVGDRMYDVEGAMLCGIDCMGVTYGYGSRRELEEAGAKYLAASTQEVIRLILGQ